MSEHMSDLVRRILADRDTPLCDFEWSVRGKPHGCCRSPNHDGEHWCTCEGTHPAEVSRYERFVMWARRQWRFLERRQ